jgi:hypothetical protein
MDRMAYIGRRYSPHLVVIRPHEDVCDSLASHAQNPLVKVLGLGVGDAALHGRVDQTIDTHDLVVLGQHRDIVLEGVWHPETLVAHI